MSDAAPDAAGRAAGAVEGQAPSGPRADARTTTAWRRVGMRFVSESGDAPALVVDGNGRVGPSPIQLLLHSLAGCTGADVVDILAKMRVPIEDLSIEATASRADDPPRRYTAIHLAYRAVGVDPAHADKLRRAIDLSHEKYCSVLHSLREDIAITVALDIA
ncbi:MAG TPA: OsmC family protein [Longimicrobiales bacterium]|nr:OsmC family protein [Longimicrobiales bacterium]